VQAAQDRLLKSVGRIHSFDVAKESVALACRAGYKNINVDLMSGLPGQETGDLTESATQAEKLCATHISMYALKLEGNTPLYDSVKKGEVVLPDGDAEYEMSKAARERLSQLGYARYEVSNYAKPGYECLHNLHYWHNDDYLGVGLASASGMGGRRTTNTRDITEYIDKLNGGEPAYSENAKSSDEEYAFETLMLGLRLVRGIDLDEYEARHGIDLRERFKQTLDSLQERGLVDIYEGRLYLTEKGMDIQNTVLVEFMEKYDMRQ
jgi:oxygen-independent coproporphyrinogen-3 oxidase